MTLSRQHGEVDAEQFAALVSPHLVALRRYAATRGSLQDAEDLVQDALARAWTKRAQFEPERGPMVAWLIAILTDRARQRWRAGDRPLALDDGDRSTPGPDGVRVDLRRAVNALPQRQQLAIVLHHYVDLSVDDVAAVMGCSSGTVKSTLHDARRSLATRLGVSYERS
jgi:DNA-directed RNA polymerase specialized sigma24 family protein